jgi:hypothetical protein
MAFRVEPTRLRTDRTGWGTQALPAAAWPSSRNADDILLTKVLWGFILVPIALLWIVGGGSIRTVR